MDQGSGGLGRFSGRLCLLSPSSHLLTTLFKLSRDQAGLAGWCEMMAFLPALNVHLPSGPHPFLQSTGQVSAMQPTLCLGKIQ